MNVLNKFFGDIDSFSYKRIDGYFGAKEEKKGEEAVLNNPVEYPFIVEIFLAESSEYIK